MKQTPQQIRKRYEKTSAHKNHWRGIYEDAYRYCLPNRNLFDSYESGTPGHNKMVNVFDSTAIDCTYKFANRIQSSIFPPHMHWCRLEPGKEIPEEMRLEAERVLNEYTTLMFDAMRQSQFDMAIGEFLLELAVGTACMLIQPGDENMPIRYTCIPTFLINFESGPDGRIDKVYRRLKLAFTNIELQFPDVNIPEELRQQYLDREDEEVELIEATCFDKDEGNYKYYVIDKSGNYEIVYRVMSSFPWVISRYMKAANEHYGRGPCLTALPDIKTLNKVKELTLKNASLNIAGVYTAADDGILNPNTISILPGAIIPVARNGGPQGESLKPLPRSGDLQMSQFIVNDLVTSIKKIMLDESLPPENMSARSATEIAERMKELSQNLGAAFGRLINECMYPLVRRTLDVMAEAGMIEMPLRVNGLEVKVIPVAPLAKTSQMEKVQDVLQFLQISQQLPAAQLAIKQDAIVDFIAKEMDIPASLLNTPEERQMMQEQIAQAAEQEAAAQGTSVMDVAQQAAGVANALN